MPDVRALTKEVLTDANHLILAVHDEEGSWATPVTFVADDAFNMYWLSQGTTQHSRAIEMNGAIAGAIIASGNHDRERALQIAGVAKRIEEAPVAVLQQATIKWRESEQELRDQIVRRELYWYCFIPSRLELIYNEHFGYDRQRVV